MSGEYMDFLLEMGDPEFTKIYAEASSEADRETAELFGDKEDLPDDESDIVFDSDLSHEEKVQLLQVIRATKLSDDVIRAKALGVKFD